MNRGGALSAEQGTARPGAIKSVGHSVSLGKKAAEGWLGSLTVGDEDTAQFCVYKPLRLGVFALNMVCMVTA